MKIEKSAYAGEGLIRVYENNKWMVGVKNWKPANDIANIDCLERHNETDELFVLLSGACTLLYANEDEGGGLEISAERMEPNSLYKIPQGLWHNTVTMKDTKLLLVEDSATGSHNSNVLMLDAQQLAKAKALAAW